MRQNNVGKYNIYFRRERVSIKIPLEKNIRRKIVGQRSKRIIYKITKKK